ncbi:bifunctional DNA primase/polymerase [Mycolicibacillus trivialis]|uniref:Bifunctional DNA primase/polymerase n=1 Tax=Mycolicibacter acidiphilus TaxID=2835306 RepID=A0ABS5RCR8_9MYCO|nr:bifunctional DNA primase/polymerase [Mycolicibacter acidiphilus]MBS9532076.1 bifunctional DNA primase/polymerase [Mycolicibacter acidiphilus]
MSHVTKTDGTEARAAALSALLAEAPDNTDHEAVRKFMHRLAEAGCAVLMIYPDSKLPADMRTPRKRSADDKAAREAAEAAGNRLWAKVKSAAGVALATTDTAVLDGYLDKYLTDLADQWTDGVPVNLAVAAGSSRLVVVDADTPEQVAAFGADGPPTVATPGQLDPATGEMAHRDGGHWWFTVPDGVELPAAAGAGFTSGGDDAYAVKYGNGYVLIPPSTRPEGAYTVTGTVAPLPNWLAEAITAHGRARAQRAQRTVSGLNGDVVAAWGASTSWAEILAGVPGWQPTGKADTCGCATWTAPGVHASPKSATAHEAGCPEYPGSPDPCLHIWTDGEIEPFGPKVAEFGPHLTRLRAVAAIYYDNDEGAAMTELRDTEHGEAEFAALVAEGMEDFDAEGHPAQRADGARSVPRDVTLPSSFWEARESLRHVRDAALKDRAAPDATLAAALARISAWTPPRVTVDTGIMSPVSLNFYAAAVSWSGKGKTSATEAADRVLRLVPSWSTDPMDSHDEEHCPVMVPDGEPFPRVGKIRSGEGIAEAFWGDATVPDLKGKPVKVRRRIRSNVLMHTDEASSLVKYILDAKQTVGETLREGWSGQHIGQSNGEAARYRFVERGSYRLALSVGFHLSVLAEILTAEQVLVGTPQRFYAAWSKPDPKQVSREMLKALPDRDPLTVSVPAVGMRLCASLREKVDEERITEWLRDDDADDEPDLKSQRVAMVARLAGLLAILDGRTETDDTGLLVLNEDDWQLAEVMFSTSVAIAQLAAADHRRRGTKAKREERRRLLGEAIEDEDARATPVGRAKARIVGYLTELGAGEHRWSGEKGIVRRFNQTDAEHAAVALEELARESRVRLRDGARKSKFVELID